MSSISKSDRLWSVDLSRGVLIILMALGHTIYFVHNGHYRFLSLINGFADIICFTSLILLSGIAAYWAYLDKSKSLPSASYRIIKRLLAYLIGYYLLALFGYLIKFGWSWQAVWNIALFRYHLPFTEFLITFIAFGLIKVPLNRPLAKLARSLPATLIVGIIIYCFGIIFYRLNLPEFIWPWKALLAGQAGFYSYPILFYAPVYLFGLWLGAQLSLRTFSNQLKLYKQLFIFSALILFGTVAVGALFSIPPSGLLHRFPPTPTFLLLGITLVSSLLYLFKATKNFKYHPLLQHTFLIFGQNAFLIYWAHTLLLFIYQWFHLPTVSSGILTAIFFISSLLFSLYLAKIIPLNYKYGLTVYAIIDDFKITPSEQTRYTRLTHQFVSTITNIPRLFSFRLGQRQINLLSGKIIFTSFVFIGLMVTQLGVAEELLINQAAWKSLKGKVDLTWITTLNPKLVYQLEIPPEIQLDPDQTDITYAIDNQLQGPMEKGPNHYKASINAAALNPGKHQLTTFLKIGNATLMTQPTDFYLSAPLYVTWTVDWEGYDVPDQYLNAMSQIADSYQLPITHMFNPYIYSSPDISPQRANTLTNWVKRRLSQGDDFGLHLHMFPDYVALSGVTPKTDAVWGGGITPGYDVLTTAYSYSEMKQILAYSQKVLAEQGLPIPQTYRAGAWFANLDTLKALQDSGFVADTSGRTNYVFGTNQIRGFWDLSSTTQPYYPSVYDQNSATPPPQLKLLEIPNNGADDYAFNTKEMLDRFTANFSAEPLQTPRQITYLSHPQWLNPARQTQMNYVFNKLNQHSAVRGLGPVVFVTLTDVYQAFK